MGNGGSSCDAAHVAVEFQHPITAGTPGADCDRSKRDVAMMTAVGNESASIIFSCVRSSRRREPAMCLIGDRPAAIRQILLGLRESAGDGADDIGLAGGERRPHGRSGLRPLPRRAEETASTAFRNAMSRSITFCGISCIRCLPMTAAGLPRRGKGTRMKYVDEFRDPRKGADADSRRSSALTRTSTPRTQPLQIMEVCGGHTHSIFRYGIEECCRRRSSWCMARAARSACCRWAASTIAWRWPRHPGVIFTTFGDAMRVPGSRKSLLQAKADGADVRMVYSPLDALDLARKNPDREVVSSASASRRRCLRPL